MCVSNVGVVVVLYSVMKLGIRTHGQVFFEQKFCVMIRNNNIYQRVILIAAFVTLVHRSNNDHPPPSCSSKDGHLLIHQKLSNTNYPHLRCKI